MKGNRQRIRQTSIRKRLTAFISLGIVIVSLGAIVVIGWQIFSVTTSLMHDHIINVSDNEARRATTELTDTVSEAASLAATLSGWEKIPEPDRRNAVSFLIRQNTARNRTLSSWAEWQAGTFDPYDKAFAGSSYSDSTGRFMSCWTMTDNTVRQDHLNMQNADWLRYVKDNPRPHMLEPHITMIGSAQEYISSAIAPIYNSSDDICGMAGIDVNLAKINTQLSSLRLYNTGYGIFISSNGFILGHKDQEMQGKLFDMFIDSSTSQYFKTARISKQAVTFFTGSGYSRILNVVSPVYVDGTADPWFFVTRTPVRELYKTGMFLLLFVTAALIVLLGVCVIVTAAVSHQITKPLNKVAKALKNISEGDGDLSVRLIVEQNDEVGQLSDSFNKTMEKISCSVSLIKTESTAMQQVGVSLSENMNKTSEIVQTITENIASVEAQMQEHSAGVSEAISAVDQIVKNINNLNGRIEDQATGVAQSSSAIEQITKNIDSVSGILKSNQTSVSELETASETGLQNVNETVRFVLNINNQSEALSETSKLIKKIATQTNMLAMNAAIEAAHAGNAGYGFAVVAEEIRHLAEQSGSEGAKIEKMLKDVKASIGSVTESASVIQKQFSVIFDLIKTVGQKEKSINESMHEQNEGGRQILQAMRQIHESTIQVKSASSEMMLGSREVSIEMAKLASMTQTVNHSMTDMTAKTGLISETVDDVSGISRRNLESINTVLNDINKFKIQTATAAGRT
jgi:methyl-accepting chemotaxis protein